MGHRSTDLIAAAAEQESGYYSNVFKGVQQPRRWASSSFTFAKALRGMSRIYLFIRFT